MCMCVFVHVRVKNWSTSFHPHKTVSRNSRALDLSSLQDKPKYIYSVNPTVFIGAYSQVNMCGIEA